MGDVKGKCDSFSKKELLNEVTFVYKSCLSSTIKIKLKILIFRIILNVGRFNQKFNCTKFALEKQKLFNIIDFLLLQSFQNILSKCRMQR